MSNSVAQSIASRPKRLPVNHRKTLTPDDQRKRTRVACNSCNSRRIKCSGTKPYCSQCSYGNRECEYPEPEKKVNIPCSELEELKAKNALYEKLLLEAIPDAAERQALVTKVKIEEAASTPTGFEPMHSSPATSSSTMTMPIDGDHHYHAATSDVFPTQGASLQDCDGTERWFGGTSGATFLDHLKRFMHTLKESLGYCDTPTGTNSGSSFLASRGQYQTSDSQPLVTLKLSAANTYVQPTKDVINKFLSKVDCFVQDGGGTYTSGGIYFLGDFSIQGWDEARREAQARSDPKNIRGKLAYYEAAFAYGSLFSLTTANSRQDGKLGETFFMRARKILHGFTLDALYGIRDIPTFILVAMYMLEMNRRDAAYTFVEFGLNICNTYGLNRSTNGDEKVKRQFWTLYCMNRDLSCMMGRPTLIADEAIQLEFPVDTAGLPSSEGLIAHILLARIAGYIVSNTYGIAPSSDASRFQTPSAQVEAPLQMLREWHHNLPLSLQITYEQLPTDRSLCTLHMKYHQLMILTLRPVFFLAVKSVIGGDLTENPRPIDRRTFELIHECGESARLTTLLGRHIYTYLSPDGKLIMPDLHHIFNAAIILLLQEMIRLHISTTVTMGITFARNIFEKEAAYGDRYGRDCFNVLNDLSALVSRLRPVMFKDSNHAETGDTDQPVVVISPDQLAQNLAKSHGLPGFGEGKTNYQVVADWTYEADFGSLENYPQYNVVGSYAGF